MSWVYLAKVTPSIITAIPPVYSLHPSAKLLRNIHVDIETDHRRHYPMINPVRKAQ